MGTEPSVVAGACDTVEMAGERTIEIPPVVRNKAALAGRPDWVDELPGIVDDLARRWDLTIGRAYSGGTEAFVCRADSADGTAAVLKVMVPREPVLAVREATVLRLADGDGCARLLAFEPEHQALLIERLGSSMTTLGLPPSQQHAALCDAASRLWRPAPAADLPSGAWKAEWLADFIMASWERLGRPCSETVVEHALACAERRRAAHRHDRAVLVHGDLHQGNALQARDGPFKLVDPDGLLAEPEYDLGIIMREDPIELMAGHPDERADFLAGRTGCDVTAIREWGIVERVATGLLCVEIDLQPVGDQMLEAAEFVTGWSD